MTYLQKKSKALAALLLALFACHALAAGQDHPLLSGMAGYEVDSRKMTEFGVYEDGDTFFCTPSRKCNASDAGFGADGKLVAEGKVTVLRYANRGAGKTLAVARNYEEAVRSLGGRKLTNLDNHESLNVFLVEKDKRRTWVVLENSYSSSYKLTYIEEKPMQQVVKAGELADAINKQGFATLHINFDNNSAVIKPDAKISIDQVTALLMQDKTLRLSIEGHTDNVGSAPANKTLSAARAASMVKALVASGIDAKRLQVKGFGSEVPVADNRSEEGRAKNRRVELVKLK
ncbi:MAG: hypothetical protein JWR60_2438 [Polaromonas sp.]|nr:hypothetical protein [Polaromonas sp.]